MIERFTVRSFVKMLGHPTKCLELVDEDYFNTMDKCEEWCAQQFDIKDLNFEIHHSLGAKNYRFGIASGMGIISWLDKDYTEHNYPTVRAWWSIYDVPPEVDAMCQGVKF
jgi:hypothetical protein